MLGLWSKIRWLIRICPVYVDQPNILGFCALRHRKAVNCLEEAFEDAMAIMVLPDKYRKRLRTTNMQERLNEEIRRRERVIRIFPNDESALRLIGALLAEFNEQWQTRRYLDMDEFNDWLADKDMGKSNVLEINKLTN